MDYTNWLAMINMQLDDAVDNLTKEQFKELADIIREELIRYESKKQ